MMSVALLCGGCGQDFKETREKAKQGHAEAQFKVGEMYRERVPKNDKEAAKWMRKAAEQGNSSAQKDLSVMYSTGAGVPLDYVEVVKWMRKAAEQGHTGAQYNLGRFHYYGSYGVPKDEVEGYAWLLLAKANGIKESSEKISDLEKRLTAKQMEKGQARALELHRLIEERKPKPSVESQ